MKNTATWSRILRSRAASLAASVTITMLLAGSARAAISQETGSLSGGRDGHRAFRLADGRVLVLAGLNEARDVAMDTEIYDPASERWSPSGRMNVARYASSVAMLSDGRILVVGGSKQEGSRDPRIAEIYDPSTGAWAESGRMKRKRYAASATLLADGQVLIAGGELRKKTHQTDEIYAPSTGTFSAPVRMPMGFQRHSATRLPDGRVLLAGGLVWGGTGADALLYDPSTDTWTQTGSRSETVGDHAAILLPTTGEVLAFKGTFSELYDPSIGQWRRTGDLPSDYAAFAVAVTEDGRVLRVSGNEHPPGGSPTPKVDIYSPATEIWSDGGRLLQSRYGCTATLLLDGGVLVVGGRDVLTNTAIRTAEILTP